MVSLDLVVRYCSTSQGWKLDGRKLSSHSPDGQPWHLHWLHGWSAMRDLQPSSPYGKTTRLSRQVATSPSVILVCLGLTRPFAARTGAIAGRTKLYVHNALVEMEVVHNGGFAMLEHPADPMEEPKVSSWQTNFNRIFGKAMPSSIPIQIGQWKYGAESVKPTIIRSMGGDAETKRDFLSFQDHSLIKPTSVLAGLDSKGQFKTSAAKEYPWRLSKALAYTMLRGISRAVAKRPLRDVTSTLLEGDFEWLKSYARTSSCISADSHWLPDYQR